MKKIILLASLVFSINAFAQVPSYVPTNGLQGWWPFSGNVNDISANANNGTVNGASLTIDRYGVANKAYSFDGVDDFIEVFQPFLGGANAVTGYTISVWFKMNSLSSSLLLGQSSYWRSHWSEVTSSGQIGFNGENISGYYGATSAIGSITLNTWQNAITVYDGNTLKIYLNNNLVVNQLVAFSSLDFSIVVSGNSTGRKLFGCASTVSSGLYAYHNGDIDDIGMWNRALDSCEIKDLYFASLGNCCNISVTTQPINQSVNISNNAQFTTASSDPLATYQWQTDLGVGFQNLNSVGQYSGTTNDTLTIANTTLSNNNQPFRCIISSGSCTDTSNVAVLTVNNNVGINDVSQSNLFSVYPNPASTLINVKADASLVGSVYSIYDNVGKVVLSGKINSVNASIALGNLSRGIYLFSIGGNMKQTIKVIKE